MRGPGAEPLVAPLGKEGPGEETPFARNERGFLPGQILSISIEHLPEGMGRVFFFLLSTLMVK